MGTVFNILKGTVRGIKKGRNSIKKLSKASAIAQDPKLAIKIILSPILRSLGIIFITLLIIMAPIVMMVEGISSIVANVNIFSNSNLNFTESAEEWANNLSDEEVKSILKDTGVNPRKIPKYVKAERDSYPKSLETKIKITTDIDGNVTNSEENYTLDLSSAAYEYRTPWKFILALDQVKETSEKLEDMQIVSDEGLKPQFIWAYDKYSKDVTNYTKTWTVTTADGSVTNTTKPQTVAVTKSYPLPFIEKAETPFKSYSFSYTEDIETEHTEWSSAILVSERSWSVDYIDYYEEDEEGKKVPVYGTTNYTEKTYKQVKEKVVEDIFVGRQEVLNTGSFFMLQKRIDIADSDIQLVHDIISEFPDSSDTAQSLKDLLDFKDMYGVSGGSFGFSGGIDIGTTPMAHNIPLFIQHDSRWGNAPYGNHGTIGSAGCGTTSMAMIMTGLQANYSSIDTNNDGILDPLESSNYSAANGFRYRDPQTGVYNGTDWGFYGHMAKKFGLNLRIYSPSQYRSVYEELKKGNPVIASMGPGHFTKGGHFIVLVGLDKDGKVIVNDPNSYSKSKMVWDFESIIVLESKQFWAFDNPNRPFRYFAATAYTGAYEENGGEAGMITAWGNYDLRENDLRNKLIAVDRNVIKLGSKVYIEFPENVRYQVLPDGSKLDLNGFYTAVDTGSAIKEYKIDLYIGKDAEGQSAYKKIAYNFGVRTVKIYYNSN